MKNLSSSSSSSSSKVNSLSYNTKNGPSPGCCIARIIRRILCISNIPSSSYPFDHFKEEENDPLVPGAPGLVARLMGLESMTPITSNPSTNSIDSLRSSNRKIIPSAYQEFEDENFFIFSFDQEEENIEFIPSNLNSPKMMRAKCKKKKKSRRRRRKSFHQEWNKENEGFFNEGLEENLDPPPPNHKKKKSGSIVLGPLKNSCEKSERFMKIKAKQDKLGVVKIEKECDSENSSPNSVLDFLESETATSGNISSRLENSKLRRTLSEELENFKNTEERRKSVTRSLRTRNQNYAEIWDKIGNLAAREMIKSSWLEAEISKNHIHFKQIGRDVASEILQQLLDELLISMI